ncbi:MAG: hypothetical protein LKJ17_06250 [Oscillospiraceae bacterium]|nr:hypothetical protein [Oscillospiraceae bacterium]
MDYSEYDEFPFPSGLSESEERLKAYFMSLPDEQQLRLLNGSRSYEEFCGRVKKSMPA